MTAETISSWVQDPAARKRYVEAFQRSDFEAMLNYYKRNYPRAGADAPPTPQIPKLKLPVLMFHGLGDTALHSDGLSGTWNWIDKDLTLVTVPGAGHFVQQDAAELVSSTMRWWLTMRATP
jgi:pimeloyl-ACP methyl ester carboxylesterase